MIHPHTELQFISEEVGYGVVATQLIPKGTITWVQDKLDREFSPAELYTMDSVYQEILATYTFRNNKGNYVLCWDNERFINHSFKSNCLTTAYDFEVAVRNIQVGEQVTNDYGYLNLPYTFRGIDEGTKRKVVHPDDLLKYYKVWDKKLSKAVKRVNKVEQPLRMLIHNNLWKHLLRIQEGEDEMDSILLNYYPQKNDKNTENETVFDFL